MAPSITYLGQEESVRIDEELMGPLGFSVDQLMELAGLSVAAALHEQYPPHTHRRVLVISGPGNNGGDGLVAARHLRHFGYIVQVVYPKVTDKPLFHGLLTQLRGLSIPIRPWQEVQEAGPLSAQADVIVDSIFGFSFKGEPRPPFDAILKMMGPSARPPPIVSVDAPSGWQIESGPQASPSGLEPLAPDMLVSLTAPKKCAQHFKGRFHYLGGRFVPPEILHKHNLDLPPYPGSAQCVRVEEPPAPAPPGAAADSVQAIGSQAAGMRINYNLDGLEERDMQPYQSDPMRAWADWFKVALDNKVCQEVNAVSLATADAAGRPSVRVVLLKGFDKEGFQFYTNYESRKGQELDGNKFGAMCVYWEALQRQVRIEGVVERLQPEQSSEYFNSRPHGSQVGAWVSNQSQPLPNGRGELESRAEQLGKQYPEGTTVPKPAHWGGYLLRPTMIEFWQGRPSRLHDRICFTREHAKSSNWTMMRLQP